MARAEVGGTVTLLGRGNTCVNPGGEKVFPEEVEGALKSHDDVFDALVIGVPDARLGQRVGALVQPREGRTVDLTALEAHVRRQVAGYKVPRSVWLVDVIGRAPSGKPDYGWARRYAADRPASAEHPHAAGPRPDAGHPVDAAPSNPAPSTMAGDPRKAERPCGRPCARRWASSTRSAGAARPRQS